jgi:hypothetical protein
MITTMISINLFYQFWGHHGSNVRYLDCNHGGVLIIWGGVTHGLRAYARHHRKAHSPDSGRRVTKLTAPRGPSEYLNTLNVEQFQIQSLTARQVNANITQNLTPIGSPGHIRYKKLPTGIPSTRVTRHTCAALPHYTPARGLTWPNLEQWRYTFCPGT